MVENIENVTSTYDFDRLEMTAPAGSIHQVAVEASRGEYEIVGLPLSDRFLVPVPVPIFGVGANRVTLVKYDRITVTSDQVLTSAYPVSKDQDRVTLTIGGCVPAILPAYPPCLWLRSFIASTSDAINHNFEWHLYNINLSEMTFMKSWISLSLSLFLSFSNNSPSFKFFITVGVRLSNRSLNKRVCLIIVKSGRRIQRFNITILHRYFALWFIHSFPYWSFLSKNVISFFCTSLALISQQSVV